MTNGEIISTFEKAWHRSKKFLAFTLMEFFLLGLATYILYVTKQLDWAHAAVLIAITFSMTSLALAFNTTQAKQDIYTRGMAILGGNLPARLQEQFVSDLVGKGKKEAPTSLKD